MYANVTYTRRECTHTHTQTRINTNKKTHEWKFHCSSTFAFRVQHTHTLTHRNLSEEQCKTSETTVTTTTTKTPMTRNWRHTRAETRDCGFYMRTFAVRRECSMYGAVFRMSATAQLNTHSLLTVPPLHAGRAREIERIRSGRTRISYVRCVRVAAHKNVIGKSNTAQPGLVFHTHTHTRPARDVWNNVGSSCVCRVTNTHGAHVDYSTRIGQPS